MRLAAPKATFVKSGDHDPANEPYPKSAAGTPTSALIARIEAPPPARATSSWTTEAAKGASRADGREVAREQDRREPAHDERRKPRRIGREGERRSGRRTGVSMRLHPRRRSRLRPRPRPRPRPRLRPRPRRVFACVRARVRVPARRCSHRARRRSGRNEANVVRAGVEREVRAHVRERQPRRARVGRQAGAVRELREERPLVRAGPVRGHADIERGRVRRQLREPDHRLRRRRGLRLGRVVRPRPRHVTSGSAPRRRPARDVSSDEHAAPAQAGRHEDDRCEVSRAWRAVLQKLRPMIMRTQTWPKASGGGGP